MSTKPIWIEVGGKKWATDGACLIRKGKVLVPGERADGNAREWKAVPPDAISRKFHQMTPMFPVLPQRIQQWPCFDAGYAGIFRHALAMGWSVSVVEFGYVLAAAVLTKKGRVAALIMPMNPDPSTTTATVDHHGNVVKGPLYGIGKLWPLE